MPPESNQLIGLTRFHCDLRAALLAGVPLSFAAAGRFGFSPRTTTMAEVDRLEQRLLERCGHSSSLNAALDEASELPPAYRAALRINAATSATTMVLDGLATRLLARQGLAKLIRPTLTYLIIVFTVAAVGMSLFSEHIFPSVQLIRDDLRLTPAVDTPPRHSGSILRAVFAGLLSSSAVLLLWACVGGGSRLVSWLGGRRYQTQRAAATAVRAAGRLIDSGVPAESAVQWACDLVGNERAVRSMVEASVGVGSESRASDGRLESQAAYLYRRSAHRLTMLRLTLPTLLVAGVGGIVVLVYGLLILWPLLTLFKDLALPAS